MSAFVKHNRDLATAYILSQGEWNEHWSLGLSGGKPRFAVGGVFVQAAGPIQINGEARRHIWQIFRNYQGVALPNSFFAVRAQAGEAAPVVRALQTVGEGPFEARKGNPCETLSISYRQLVR